MNSSSLAACLPHRLLSFEKFMTSVQLTCSTKMAQTILQNLMTLQTEADTGPLRSDMGYIFN